MMRMKNQSFKVAKIAVKGVLRHLRFATADRQEFGKSRTTP
jgi:hypothetical protein